MERIDIATPDLTQENIDKIAELFPDVVTEAIGDDGELRRAIDFDALRGDLADEVVDGQRERYQFTWPGKAAAKLEARTPCDKAFRPCIEESKDWDTTQNLYIEGDNLDALKLLRETYAGKVKLIYIDPPYNTGHDFIYDDDFSQSREDYEGASDEYDEEGGRLVANPESNGRFHSDWCSMMYPRLLLARDLLKSDGAIFISIDVHEFHNLKMICDEIFGEVNHRNTIAVRRGVKNVQAQFDDVAALSQGHEYILMYSKSPTPRLPKLMLSHDGKPGKWDTFWRGTDRPTMRYDLFGICPSSGQWRWEINRAQEAIENYGQFLKRHGSMTLDEYYLDHLTATNEKLNFVRKNEDNVVQYYVPPSEGKLLSDNWMDLTLSGNETDEFDTEKSVNLIGRIVNWIAPNDDLVLDFFSGSATTAHAVMLQALSTTRPSRYIMIQIDAPCTNNNSMRIVDIGKERICRAGEKIAIEVEELNKQLKIGEGPRPMPDIGFRVLKIDSSNFNDTYRNPEEFSQDALAMYVDNLKEGRTPEDLLFQVLPKFRIPLSAKIKELDICGKQVFDVNDGQMLACFDAGVGIDTIEAIARRKPVYAVFRDASMADDSTEANFEELFKTFSPDTVRKVI